MKAILAYILITMGAVAAASAVAVQRIEPPCFSDICVRCIDNCLE